MGTEALVGTVELCRLAGVTFRQADYLTRTGRLRPTVAARGSGSRRSYDLREVQIAWLLGQVSGIGVRTIPETGALRHLERWTGWFVVVSGHGEYVSDPDLLALWPVAVVIDLDACPVGVASDVTGPVQGANA